MAAFSLPRGLIVDLITPLRADRSIDGKGLEKLLDRVAPHCEGILLAGPQAGEGFSLSGGQHPELLEQALNVIRGHVPLFCGITKDTAESTKQNLLDLRRVVESQDYNGLLIWVDTPLLYHSNRGLPAHYRELGALVPEPLVLINDPGLIKTFGSPFKRNNIRTAVLRELHDQESVAGLLFSGSLERSHNYQRAARRRCDFRIYDGDEDRFLNYPSMSGLLSSGANLTPRSWHTITRSSIDLTGPSKAFPDSLHQIWQIGRYLRAIEATSHGRTVAVIKHILAEAGIIETTAGDCDWSAEDIAPLQEQIRALMDQLGENV